MQRHLLNRTCLTALIVAPLAVSVVGVLPAGASAAALADDCATTTVSFAFTGGPQDYVVPEGVTSISIDVFGAEGGSFAPTQVKFKDGRSVATPR